MSKSSWPKGALSPTQVSEARRCPKAHKLNYVQGLKSKGSATWQHFGRAGHEILERLGNALLAGGETPVELWEEEVTLARETHLGELPDEAMKLTLVMSEYRRTFGFENAGYGPYDLEATETTLTGGTLLASRGGFACIADAVIWTPNGRAVVEHKFNAKQFYGEDEDIVRALKLDDQVCALAYCGREKYGEIPRVLYNVCVKTKNPKFQRIWLDLTDEELASWEKDTQDVAQVLDLSCANRNACVPKGGGFPCSYVDYCYGTKEQQQTLYEVRFRK